MINLLVSTLVLLVMFQVLNTDGFSPPSSSARATSRFNASSSSTDAEEDTDAAQQIPSKVIAVTGATGRTGRLVVSQLLESTNHKVIAIVRDENKANELFGSMIRNNNNEDTSSRLVIKKCDLLNENQINNVIESTNVEQLIWCSTGFSSNPNASPLDRLNTLWNALVKKGENTIDYIGLVSLAKAIENTAASSTANAGPKVIMLSSAGVTRPAWSEEKKEKFEGCADIPIVRLNPFNILNIKATSEEKLRECGVSYTIVRPTGLKDGDDWFCGSNARPIISQGDVAVGRIHRNDVASMLLSCLESTNAAGKTFEVFSLGGYQPPTDLEKVFKPLQLDSNIRANGGIDDNILQATYFAMQQLLPGQKQDAAALAMGQTYEELDVGKVGRLGVRGEESAESVAPQPSPV